MKKIIKAFVILSAITLFSSGAAALQDGPVAMLIEAKGSVFYSPDGRTWKDVNRNKFLFESWRVKTSENGTCMLLNRHTEMLEPVNSNTELEISSKGTRIIAGTAAQYEPAKNLAGYFKRKFADIQKFTGVNRYGKTYGKVTLATAKDITLSDDYPEMVWENAGTKYDYQLTVGKKVFQIPGSKRDIIRFKLTDMEPGSFKYSVQVLFDDEIIYAPQKNNTLKWLSNDEKSVLNKEKLDIVKIAPDNGFLMGSFLDEKGLKVAAMDQYKRFLSDNPDADEIRPFLIKVLNELELGKAEKAEMEKLHSK
ncbi:Uncharacterized protein dnl_01160 [Desulfonema limicola]|uniref:Uncharacterized protein n=1 Tax=Desulfonema limicola TaxID=45656 RepID=A0A975B349_9BACT|nr:hypothetical protein [Desulfonema limicola]QTA77914.1 Uncharacterized protein dnl_01160 [Desulfonema limicola]